MTARSKAVRSNRAVPSLRRAFGAYLRTVRVARGSVRSVSGSRLGSAGNSSAKSSVAKSPSRSTRSGRRACPCAPHARADPGSAPAAATVEEGDPDTGAVFARPGGR